MGKYLRLYGEKFSCVFKIHVLVCLAFGKEPLAVLRGGSAALPCLCPETRCPRDVGLCRTPRRHPIKPRRLLYGRARAAQGGLSPACAWQGPLPASQAH